MSKIFFKNNLKDYDLFFSYIGFILGLILTLFFLYKHLPYFNFSIAISLAFLMYVIIKRNKTFNQFNNKLFNYSIKIKRYYYILFNILFLILFCLSILSLRFVEYGRPLLYFIILSLMCVIVFYETLIANDYNYFLLILIKIIIIAINLRSSLYYSFPGLYSSDPYYWVSFVNYTIYYSHIQTDVLYYHYPIFNLILSICKIITSLNIKDTMFLSIGLLEIIGIYIIYLIGLLIKKPKIGLIAALLLSIFPYNIRMGALIFQSTIGLIFFSILVYLLIKSDISKNNLINYFLIFFLLIIILTHHLSSFILLIFLIIYTIVFSILENLEKNRNIFSSKNFMILLFFSLTLFTYWMYNGSWQFEYSIKSLTTIMYDIFDKSNEIIISPVEYDFNYVILRNIGMSLFILFSIIGILFWFHNNKTEKGISLISLISMLLIFLFIIGGLNIVLAYRWIPFLFLLISLPAAAGLIIFINIIKIKNLKITIIFFILIFFLSFNLISTYNEDMEYSPYNKTKELWRYTDQDFVVYNSIMSYNVNDEIFTDPAFGSLISVDYSDYSKYKNLINVNNIIDIPNNPNNNIILRIDYINKYNIHYLERNNLKIFDKTIKLDGIKLSKELELKNNLIYTTKSINWFS